jgi:hypothetical protein
MSANIIISFRCFLHRVNNEYLFLADDRTLETDAQELPVTDSQVQSAPDADSTPASPADVEATPISQVQEAEVAVDETVGGDQQAAAVSDARDQSTTPEDALPLATDFMVTDTPVQPEPSVDTNVESTDAEQVLEQSTPSTDSSEDASAKLLDGSVVTDSDAVSPTGQPESSVVETEVPGDVFTWASSRDL